MKHKKNVKIVILLTIIDLRLCWDSQKNYQYDLQLFSFHETILGRLFIVPMSINSAEQFRTGKRPTVLCGWEGWLVDGV